ncbi:hypothetical protein H0H93_002229 [Arthromyces matolae]|nr:hypothetical protein H0H93_002229 [Arthromyces matolae]
MDGLNTPSSSVQLTKKSSGRGAKLSNVQIESTNLARKSNKRIDKDVTDKATTTRTTLDYDASMREDRGEAYNASSSTIRTKGLSSMQASADVLSISRMKSSSGKIVPENMSRSIGPNRYPQVAPPAKNAVAGPSNHGQHYAERDDGTHRSSLGFPLPSARRNQPNRKTIPDPSDTPSARRLTLMRPSSAKAPAMKPHWQLDDEERAREPENSRHFDISDRTFIKRIGARPTRSQLHSFQQFRHSKAYLGRNLILRKHGEQDSESGSDSAMDVDERPSLQKRVRNTVPQIAAKAARKREWPPPLFEPSSSDEDEDVDVPTASSDEKEVDELDSTESEEETEPAGLLESVPDVQRASSPVEIEILPAPPRPQTLLTLSEGMRKAIDALALSSIRMQKTKRLPFLRRNVKRGFLWRCNQLNVSTNSVPGETVRVRVQFAYQSEEVKARLHSWTCPLCELHGDFPTQDTLSSHLSWDHETTSATWFRNQSGVSGAQIFLLKVPDQRLHQIWNLRLDIPDPLNDEESDAHEPWIPNEWRRSHSPVVSQQEHGVSSPLPFVTLSPPDTEAQQTLSTSRALAVDHEPISPTTRMQLRQPRLPLPPRVLSSRSSRSKTTTTVVSGSSRERSTTGTSATPAANVLQASESITPPPQSKPLGPAAQYPYLPAKSEYGGPDIYYSCRPGGPYLYDLLDTLPLEPYGVLAWEVLDREDEIFEGDNVKDEYKVMHALWGRWIVLNRNMFIKDYFEGTKAFIDFYWRMIHKAAGWDALRYWLLMLVVNRLVTGAEVAKLLKHYESLTEMDTWIAFVNSEQSKQAFS